MKAQQRRRHDISERSTERDRERWGGGEKERKRSPRLIRASFSTNKPRPQTALDAIKFVCKDLWQLIFRKPIDNLKTNHRGIFVLTDNRFQPLSRMSVDRRAGARAFEEAMRMAQAVSSFAS